MPLPNLSESDDYEWYINKTNFHSIFFHKLDILTLSQFVKFLLNFQKFV